MNREVHYSRHPSPSGKEFEIRIFHGDVYDYILTISLIAEGWFWPKRTVFLEIITTIESTCYTEAEKFLKGPIFNENTPSSNR